MMVSSSALVPTSMTMISKVSPAAASSAAANRSSAPARLVKSMSGERRIEFAAG
jgi:hypothetical protein